MAQHSPNPVLICFQTTGAYLGQQPKSPNDSPVLSKHYQNPDFPNSHFLLPIPCTHEPKSTLATQSFTSSFLTHGEDLPSLFPSLGTPWRAVYSSVLSFQLTVGIYSSKVLVCSILSSHYPLLQTNKERFKPKSLMNSQFQKFMCMYKTNSIFPGQRFHHHSEDFRKTDCRFLRALNSPDGKWKLPPLLLAILKDRITAY